MTEKLPLPENFSTLRVADAIRLVVGQLVDHPLTNDLGRPETINGAMSGYAAIPFHPFPSHG
jgi:hypothetical protein